MSSGQEMPKVDMSKDLLSATEKHYIKKMEQKNIDRAIAVKSLQNKNRLTGLLLGAGVLAIYFYTISAVKQEKFVDFEEMPDDKSTKNTV